MQKPNNEGEKRRNGETAVAGTTNQAGDMLTTGAHTGTK